MRMSEQNHGSRTETRELCILSFANFAYALSFSVPLQTGGPNLTPLDQVLCILYGGGGLKLKAHSCKLTAHESKPCLVAPSRPCPTYTLHPIPYTLPLPRSEPNSFRSRTLHTFGGRGGRLNPPSPGVLPQHRENKV